MKRTKQEKAITLIALIITIIILLILAVVTIAAITGDGDLVSHANNAGTKYTAEGEKENTIVVDYLKYIDENILCNSLELPDQYCDIAYVDFDNYGYFFSKKYGYVGQCYKKDGEWIIDGSEEEYSVRGNEYGWDVISLKEYKERIKSSTYYSPDEEKERYYYNELDDESKFANIVIVNCKENPYYYYVFSSDYKKVYATHFCTTSSKKIENGFDIDDIHILEEGGIVNTNKFY